MTTIGDYQRWRETPGGRMHSTLYRSEAEAIGEVQATVSVEAIRNVQDTHELVYGRRPTVTEARAALDRGWERGQAFTGTAAELEAMTQRQFPGQFVIRCLGERMDDSIRMGADVVQRTPPAPARVLPGAPV